MKLLSLVKGYNLVSVETGLVDGYIQEGQVIEVTLLSGEVKTGLLSKPAKKQFLLMHDNITEVIDASLVSDIRLSDEE